MVKLCCVLQVEENIFHNNFFPHNMAFFNTANINKSTLFETILVFIKQLWCYRRTGATIKSTSRQGDE